MPKPVSTVARRLRPLAAAVSVVVLLAGCGQDSPEKLVGSAKDYLAKKENGSAVIQLKTALQQEPNLAEARFLLGRALLDDGDAADAEVELRKARDLKYPDAEVVPQLAKALVAQAKGDRAIQDFGQTRIETPAGQAGLKTALASAYVQRNDTATAQKEIDAALAAEPDFAPALLMQSRLKAAKLDYDGAIALIDRVLAKTPADYEALQLKGDLLNFAMAKPDAAIAAHRQALAARKDWIPSHRSLIEILLAQRDLDGAKKQLDEMKKVLPNHPQTRLFEAEIAYLKEDYKTAREVIDQLMRGAPDNLKLLLLSANVELRSGSLMKAQSQGEKALQIAPELSATRRLLAQVYLRGGQPQKTEDVLQPLLDKPDVGADLLSIAAQAALQRGDVSEAEAYFARATKIDPADQRIRTALAMSQFLGGKAERGLAQLEEIAASDKDTAADVALVSARLRQRDYPAALAAVDGLERKQPGLPQTLQLRGQIQLQQQDVAAARASFEKAVKLDARFFPAAASLASLDLRDGKPDAARARFDQILSAEPDNVQAMLAIAELRSQSGATKQELAELIGKAIKAHPESVPARLALVDTYLRRNDPPPALAAARDATAALPDSTELMDALGRAQAASGDVNQAIIQFKRLASLQPSAPQPQLRLADAYLLSGDREASRASLRRALELAPRLLPAQRSLLLMELADRRPEQAMAIARQVQIQRPDQPVGYQLVGDVDAARKDWPAAATAYRAALKAGGSTDIAAKLHSALLSGGKKADAKAMADAWMKDRPKDAGFMSYLGDEALSRHDNAVAEQWYQAVVQLQPQNAIALNNLAWVTNVLKKPGALEIAEKALALRPEAPAIMDTTATILADAGQFARALELQKKAIALAPGQHALQLNLAKLYLKSGDKSLAKSELDQLSKLGDRFAGQSEVGDLLKSM